LAIPPIFIIIRGMTESHRRKNRRKRRHVLVTGAAGKIGSYFAGHSHRRYMLRLMVRDSDNPKLCKSLKRFGEVVYGDVTNFERMKQLCEGIDTVVHLAGDPSANATWDSLLAANIIGAYNTMVAARAMNCRRVVYASSIHAVSGYPADVQIKRNDLPNPGDLYGVTKCFGEALARYMAEKENLSCIAIRIGAFQPRKAALDPRGVRMLDTWISHRDMNQLIEKSIDVPELRFAILHGLSDNRFKRMDISDARELIGFQPLDDLSKVNPKIRDLQLRKIMLAHSLSDARQQSGLRNELGGREKL
jgi:NAD(P)-dependent dehydrogenase (short-subunit alcohol dehydrogenase family)